jgi:excinuclease ABC subunit C
MPNNTIAPDTEPAGEEADDVLPALPEDLAADLDSLPDAGIGAGRKVVARFVAHAPSAPGVYRMIGADGDVLYVGKAKNIKKRVLSYARPTGQVNRIARMVAITASIECVTTATETDALLLEANLIKRLRPRFNVLLRDDKSFPYILISQGERPAQILKHRGARNRDGAFFGPFAAVNAVTRTITALERAFLLRSCADAVFDSRTRPCLLHQIKRCAAPCTGEISRADYDELVREAMAFLSGKSRAVREELARDMEQAAEVLDFERAAVLRDRLAALAAVQARQDINPRDVEEADVFAAHQDGGFTCIEVFFFRTGQNWGNRAYFPRADRSLGAGEVLGAFLAQFYDDKPCPRLVLLSHEIEDRELLAEALSIKSDRKIEVAVPQRGGKHDLVAHAAANAREALGRKLAETASQQRLLAALADAFGLQQPLRRIEVYDNSHIQGSNPVGAMIVAGPEGFRKNQYRKFNIKSPDLAPGDDFGMMREVLTRRFKRLMNEQPRLAQAVAVGPASLQDNGEAGSLTASVENRVADVYPMDAVADRQASADQDAPTAARLGSDHAIHGIAQGVAKNTAKDITKDILPDEGTVGEPDDRQQTWPDLVFIDGGEGQLRAARETLAALGIEGVPLVGIAKGPDRDAGRETFHIAGRDPFRLPQRDPILYFIQRLRDEAHRFAIGSHRQRRGRDIREAGLQEIGGIGPARKRALLHHFGTLKAIERASIADLIKVPGVNADIARRIYDFFHGESG